MYIIYLQRLIRLFLPLMHPHIMSTTYQCSLIRYSQLLNPLVLLCSSAIALPVSAASIVVNTTTDEVVVDGACSLREALENVVNEAGYADCDGSTHLITFALPPASVITLHTELPILDADVSLVSDKKLTITRDDSAPKFRIFTIVGQGSLGYPVPPVNVRLEGLTLTNGWPPFVPDSKRDAVLAQGGGAILNREKLRLKNCIISGNYSEAGAGGINNYATSAMSNHAELMLENTIVAHNQTYNTGGGINNHRGILWMQNSIIFQNTVKKLSSDNRLSGGGLATRNIDAKAFIINSIISENQIINPSDRALGGGIYSNKESDTLIINSTIINNSISHYNFVSTGGAGIARYPDIRGYLKIYNSIVAHNRIAGVPFNMTGGITGNHNIQETPFLTNPSYNITGQYNLTLTTEEVATLFTVKAGQYAPIYQLTEHSPAIDAGDNAYLSQYPFSITSDIQNLPRISNGTVDIGATEYQVSTITEPSPPEDSPDEVVLTLAAQGKGTVFMTTNDRTKTCRTACSYGYPTGSAITLKAEADLSYLFTGWSHPRCEAQFSLETATICVARFRQKVVEYHSAPLPNRTLEFVSEYGEATTQTLTVINAQTGELTVDFLDISGAQATAFSVAKNDLPLSLATEETAAITVTCQPTDSSPQYTAYLNLKTNDTNRRTATYLLACTNRAYIPPPLIPTDSPTPLPPLPLETETEFGHPSTTLDNYAVRLNRLGEGTLQINGELCEALQCDYQLAAGTDLTLAAKALGDSYFKAWQCAGQAAYPNATLNLQLNNPLACTALFTRPKSLRVRVSPPQQGRITGNNPLLPVDCQDDCAYQVPPELDVQQLSLKIDVQRGWLLEEWTGECSQSHLMLMIPENNCIPIFQRPPFKQLYREFNFYDAQGYQISLPFSKRCALETLYLDAQQLGDAVRRVEFPLSNSNNLCTARLVPDSDHDTIPDEIEQTGANAGDGNYDGIPDFQQSHVMNIYYKNRRNKDFATLEFDPDCQLQSITINPEPFMARIGIADFDMTGCSKTQLRILYHSFKLNHLVDIQGYNSTNKPSEINEMQLSLSRAVLFGGKSNWYARAIPYFRNLIQSGEIILNPQGLPVVEGFLSLKQEQKPTNSPLIKLHFKQAEYSFYESQRNLDIKVTLEGNIDKPLTVHVGGGTLKYPHSYHYQISPQKLTWYPEQTTTQTLTISTPDDDIPEETLQIFLSLGDASQPNVWFDPDSIVGVFILDDDLPICGQSAFKQTLRTLPKQAGDIAIQCDLAQQTIDTQGVEIFDRHCYHNGYFNKNCYGNGTAADWQAAVNLQLSQVTLTLTDSNPNQWIYIPPNSIISDSVFKHPVFIDGAEIFGTPDQYTVFHDNADLFGSQIRYAHFANTSSEKQIVSNHGSTISHAIIDPLVEIIGGTLDGTIINQGRLNNITFTGDTLMGGTVAGMITLDAGSLLQDIDLATPSNGLQTSISTAFNARNNQPAQLAGRINGDPNVPAKLKHLAIRPGTHLSNVLLGEGMVFTGPTTLSGVIQGDSKLAPILLENVLIKADSQLNHVRLGNQVTLENGVIFGDIVQITNTANISCRNANRLASDGHNATPSTACFFNHFVFTRPTARQAQHHAELYFTLLVEPQDLAQLAEIVAVAIVKTPTATVAYMRAGAQWRDWDGQLETLAALQPAHPLRRRYKIPLYRGRLNTFDGEFILYAGYRLANGDIVFNAETPLQFTLSSPQSLQLSPLRNNTQIRPIRLTESFFTSFKRSKTIALSDHAGDSATIPTQYIRQHLSVEPTHRGQPGAVIAVLSTTEGRLKILDSDLQWRRWEGDLATLLPVYRYRRLPEQLQLNLAISDALATVLYVGYQVEMTEEETILVFNGGYPLPMQPPR